MIRKATLAALVLALGLTAAGCGNQTAGTAANRWGNTNTTNSAIQWDNESRGVLDDGRYAADMDGRVAGYRSYSADGRTQMTTRANSAGQNLRNAGNDLAQGATNAARSIGNAAENAMDGITNAAKDVTGQTNGKATTTTR